MEEESASRRAQICLCLPVKRDIMDLLGCRVTDALLEQWAGHMVSPLAPFYLADDELPLLPPRAVVLTRAELAANYHDLPLETRDAYATYHVDDSAPWATLLGDAALLALPAQVRRPLLRAQWRLGRGHIYRRAVAHALCGEQAPTLDPWIVDTDDGDMVTLQHATWTALSPETRQRWVTWFVTREQPAPTAVPDDTVWAAMEEPLRTVVRHLAGTFLPHSGPNCLSTTLAATMATSAQADGIAALWLHAAPFARALAAQGYRSVRQDHALAAVPPRTILVWGADATVAQHACMVPVAGWALNKDAQGWFAPRCLVPLTEVLDRWCDAGMPLCYRPT